MIKVASAVTALLLLSACNPEVGPSPIPSAAPGPVTTTSSPVPSDSVKPSASTWPGDAEKTKFIQAVSDKHPVVSESQSSVDAVVAAGIEICATLDEISTGQFSNTTKLTVTTQTVDRLSDAATLGPVESVKVAPTVVLEAVRNFCPDQSVTIEP